MSSMLFESRFDSSSKRETHIITRLIHTRSLTRPLFSCNFVVFGIPETWRPATSGHPGSLRFFRGPEKGQDTWFRTILGWIPPNMSMRRPKGAIFSFNVVVFKSFRFGLVIKHILEGSGFFQDGTEKYRCPSRLFASSPLVTPPSHPAI